MHLDDFFLAEMSVSAVSVPMLILYFLISILMFLVIPKFGTLSIGCYRLEEDYDQNIGATNIIYRIVSPVIWSNLFLLLVSVSTGLIGVCISPECRWMPVAFYVFVLVIAKVMKRPAAFSIPAIVLQGGVSVIFAMLFDFLVIRELPKEGLQAFDSSNIGFQFILAVFFALVQMILSFITRSQYCSANSDISNRTSSYLPSEKTLYNYRRRFNELLPSRFANDILLRAVFYSIMAIEDYNRPLIIRRIENLLAKMGFAKTTGIMQQRCDCKASLSDDESVAKAIPDIERMWNSFLLSYAKSREGTYNSSADTKILFHSTWYEYRYSALAGAISSSFSLLYGDYSGTRSLNANALFETVLHFEEASQYGLIPNTIAAPGKVLPASFSQFEHCAFFWFDSDTIGVRWDLGFDCTVENDNWIISIGDDPSLDEAVSLMRSCCTNCSRVRAIRVIPGIRVELIGDGVLPDEFDSRLTETLTYIKL